MCYFCELIRIKWLWYKIVKNLVLGQCISHFTWCHQVPFCSTHDVCASLYDIYFYNHVRFLLALSENTRNVGEAMPARHSLFLCARSLLIAQAQLWTCLPLTLVLFLFPFTGISGTAEGWWLGIRLTTCHLLSHDPQRDDGWTFKLLLWSDNITIMHYQD